MNPKTTVGGLVLLLVLASAAPVLATDPPQWLHPYIGIGASGSFSHMFDQHKPGLHLALGLGVDVVGPLEMVLRGSWHPFSEDKWLWVKTTPGMDVYTCWIGLKPNLSRHRDRTHAYFIAGAGYSGYSWNTTYWNQFSIIDSDEPRNRWQEGACVIGAFGVEIGTGKGIRPFIELSLLSTVGRGVWEYSYLLNLTFGLTH